MQDISWTILKVVWVSFLTLATLALLANWPGDAEWEVYLIFGVPFAVCWMIAFFLVTGLYRHEQRMRLLPWRYRRLIMSIVAAIFLLGFAAIALLAHGIVGIPFAAIALLILVQISRDVIRPRSRKKRTGKRRTKGETRP